MSAGPSTSPPRTPDDNRAALRSNASTPTSDSSSIIDDLSFDYVLGDDGNIIRMSKGGHKPKSNHSSPPTPQEGGLQPDPPRPKPPSPDFLASPAPRISLTRSESAFPILSSHGTTSSPTTSTTGSNEKPSSRSFQRAASGPILSNPSYLAPTASSLSKPRLLARRPTLEDERERHDSMGAAKARQPLDSHPPMYGHQEEKENISESDEHGFLRPSSASTTNAPRSRGSPPLVTRSVGSASSRAASTARAAYMASSAGTRPSGASSHARQILSGPSRVGRVLKSVSVSSKYTSGAAAANFDRISEIDHGENEGAAGERYVPSSRTNMGDDTDNEDDGAGAPIDPANVPLPPVVMPANFHSVMTRVARGQAPMSANPNSAAALPTSSLSLSGSTRMRRSASLSDALTNDEYQLQVQHQYTAAANPTSRPGTSLGLNADNNGSNSNPNTGGPRRVTQQERERQEAEYKKYVAAVDEQKHDRAPGHFRRETPSPPHQQPTSARVQYAHKRRDSDTLRSYTPALGSPTIVEADRVGGHRASPTIAASRVAPARYSPPGVRGRASPPTLAPAAGRGRLSPAVAARDVAKHRRSPTAPEAAGPVGKTWAGADRGDEYGYNVEAAERERREREHREREREREREKEREREQQRGREREREKELREKEKERERRAAQLAQQSAYSQSAPSLASSTAAQQQQQPAAHAQLTRHMVVNKKAYARLDMIGKGGSSRVFRVLNHANELYAIKRVSLDKTDADTMSGYMNEIALLKRLEGNNRIIRLIDSELRPGPGGNKGHLLLVMECGEIDLARLLQEQMKEPVNMVWVAYYWQQMLQAVHVIHEEKIVHSDLKPANFVLVRGQLKLIDFGIANAIANDTTNIQRDHQIGTVNYMSPEAIELPDGMRRLKVGRPSDVWSLGCILYQMVYGQPPFQHLSVYQKMKAIPDVTHVIDFSEYATPMLPSPRTSPAGAGSGAATPVEPPRKLDHLKQRVRRDVVMSMKSCLCRNPKERATIPDLLNHGWLAMQEPEVPPPPPEPCLQDFIGDEETIINPYYMRQLLEYGMRLAKDEKQDGDEDDEAREERLFMEARRLVNELKTLES